MILTLFYQIWKSEMSPILYVFVQIERWFRCIHVHIQVVLSTMLVCVYVTQIFTSWQEGVFCIFFLNLHICWYWKRKALIKNEKIILSKSLQIFLGQGIKLINKVGCVTANQWFCKDGLIYIYIFYLFRCLVYDVWVVKLLSFFSVNKLFQGLKRCWVCF